MITDEILIDCPELGTDKIVKMVKEKETYKFTNLLSEPIMYSIVKKGCGSFIDNTNTGNIESNFDYTFIPEKDGEFIITFTTLEKKQTLIITHYPTIIKSVIKGVNSALCSHNCGCDDCNEEGKHCLTYQNIFAESQLLFGLLKSIPTCEGKDAIKSFLYHSIDVYKCDLFSLFCDKELNLKLKGTSEFSDVLTKKLIAINFLALYYYELWITNPSKEFVDYVNTKYKFKDIKECLLKTGIDVFILQTIWDQITAPCDFDVPVCSVGCFKNKEEEGLLTYSFMVNTVLNGIFHTTTIRNTCSDSKLFMDRIIFRDNDLTIKIKNKSGNNPVEVHPGDFLDIDTIFIGTKHVPTVITVPFVYEGQLINTYQLRFNQPEKPNTPPVITDIIKELDNRTPYSFTVSDFESHFTDADGDSLDRIVLVGDTTRFTLNGTSYLSGTEINRNNITQLVYTPNDTDDIYQLILNWMAFDSYGLPSN